MPQPPIRILVVDDDEDAFVLTRDLLEEAAREVYAVDWVSSFEDALEAIGRTKHAVVLLDYQLGEKTGLELLDEIRSRRINTPVILLTGHGDSDIDLAAMRAGAADFWSKAHINPTLLERSIRYAIERRNSEQALRESERRFSTLLSNLPGMAYRCLNDQSWTMQFVSEGAFGLTGYRPEDLIDNRRIAYEDLIHPDDRAIVRERVTEAIDRQLPFRLEYRIRTASGDERWVWEQGRPVFGGDGTLRALEGFITDVTERRRAEELERERNNLREATRAMEQVLGVVGHELRTPLASLQAMSEFILTDGAGGTAEFGQFVKGIHDETIRMAEMVNNMLEAARLDSGKAKWTWSAVDLARVCSDAIEIVRPLVDESKVALACDVTPPDLTMRGDADAVRRLVLNLVTNAHKYTRSGSIHVRVADAHHEDGRWIDLCVTDTGAGITKDVAMRLGTAFALNSGAVGSNYIKGAGLGLAICRGIVAAHGGSMQVSSTPGQGTTFVVQLRADLEEPANDEVDVQVIQGS